MKNYLENLKQLSNIVKSECPEGCPFYKNKKCGYYSKTRSQLIICDLVKDLSDLEITKNDTVVFFDDKSNRHLFENYEKTNNELENFLYELKNIEPKNSYCNDCFYYNKSKTPEDYNYCYKFNRNLISGDDNGTDRLNDCCKEFGEINK